MARPVPSLTHIIDLGDMFPRNDTNESGSPINSWIYDAGFASIRCTYTRDPDTENITGRLIERVS